MVFMTTIIDSHQVRAPEDLAGDLNASLDFLGREFFLAKIYNTEQVMILAGQSVLPTLAMAAAAFDAEEIPEDFQLREG